MLHTIGDSHAWVPFLNMAGVVTHHLGPVTMKRIGHPSESLLLDTFASFAPRIGPSDAILLCFCEIYVRCWVNVHIVQRKREMEELLREWTGAYLDKAAALLKAPRVAILSIVPPRSGTLIDRPNDFPVAGSDPERALYTRTANRLLEEGCKTRNLMYVDVHAHYADPDGMMRPELADSSVHINDTTSLRSVLSSLALLP